MTAIADKPSAPEAPERHRPSGRPWVAADERDRPVARLIAEPVDGDLHTEQASMHPRLPHRRLSRALLTRKKALPAPP
ncbi:hypothetical protein [Streptomyces sp. NPDC057253]|uniref:hypothetical protein n=1 Tax=Streptomyces sp. NPDC057253 TaxID=3346069 RepID=UPI0036378423